MPTLFGGKFWAMALYPNKCNQTDDVVIRVGKICNVDVHNLPRHAHSFIRRTHNIDDDDDAEKVGLEPKSNELTNSDGLA